MSMTEEAKREIERFLQRGQKIGAIKHLKDIYGFSLAESKILVEAFEGQTDSSSVNARLYTGDASLDEVSKSKVIALLRAGNKIGAIKYLKEHLNIRLKDAKHKAEELQKEINPKLGAVTRSAGLAVKMVLLIFGFVGFVFLGIAGFIFYSQTNSIGKSDLISGKVVRMEYQDGGQGSAPVIEYEWNGQKWLHVSNIYSSPPAYAVDEEIAIYVNREDPEDIVVNTFTDRYFFILIFGLLGFVFVSIPLLIVIFGSRK